jgi:hypothetical protein
MGFAVAALDRILRLFEMFTHEVLEIVRDYFELLFITALYFGGATFLYKAGMTQELSYWLTSGALMGAVITIVNRFGVTRYKNGDNGSAVKPPAEKPKE